LHCWFTCLLTLLFNVADDCVFVDLRRHVFQSVSSLPVLRLVLSHAAVSALDDTAACHCTVMCEICCKLDSATENTNVLLLLIIIIIIIIKEQIKVT